jgi:hypothetical protein
LFFVFPGSVLFKFEFPSLVGSNFGMEDLKITISRNKKTINTGINMGRYSE